MEKALENPTEYLISLDTKLEDEYDINIVTEITYYNFKKVDWDAIYSHYETKTSIFALYMLGNVYERKKEYEKAKNYYEIGAKTGDAMAINNLGYLYRYGLGVPQDYDKAKHYYEIAIEKEIASVIKKLYENKKRMKN